MGMDNGAVANFYVVVNECVRTNFYVVTQNSLGANGCHRMYLIHN